jgi:hypothetical protein
LIPFGAGSAGRKARTAHRRGYSTNVRWTEAVAKRMREEVRCVRLGCGDPEPDARQLPFVE